MNVVSLSSIAIAESCSRFKKAANSSGCEGVAKSSHEVGAIVKNSSIPLVCSKCRKYRTKSGTWPFACGVFKCYDAFLNGLVDNGINVHRVSKKSVNKALATMKVSKQSKQCKLPNKTHEEKREWLQSKVLCLFMVQVIMNLIPRLLMYPAWQIFWLMIFDCIALA